jgi:hypothetical protein
MMTISETPSLSLFLTQLVVEFVEPRNAACESMKPEVEKIASQFANDAVFYELDCSHFKVYTCCLPDISIC